MIVRLPRLQPPQADPFAETYDKLGNMTGATFTAPISGLYSSFLNGRAAVGFAGVIDVEQMLFINGVRASNTEMRANVDPATTTSAFLNGHSMFLLTAGDEVSVVARIYTVNGVSVDFNSLNWVIRFVE